MSKSKRQKAKARKAANHETAFDENGQFILGPQIPAKVLMKFMDRTGKTYNQIKADLQKNLDEILIELVKMLNEREETRLEDEFISIFGHKGGDDHE